MSDRTTLEQLEFFSSAPTALRQRLAEIAVPMSLAPDDVFYRQGDTCGQFAVVGHGDIRVFRTAESGREITLYHVQDGEPCLVNMLCTFLEQPAMASAHVEAPTEAVVIPAPAFREWVRQDDFMRRFVFTSMAKRFVDVMTLVEEVAFRRMDARLAALLIRRFSHAGGPPGVAVTTHEDLAAELGTVREVVTRLLGDFQRLGIVHAARGRLELADIGKLARLAGGNGEHGAA